MDIGVGATGVLVTIVGVRPGAVGVIWGLSSPGGEQLGKNAPDAILDVCLLVALLPGRKYARLAGGMHGSPSPPHGYPVITPLRARPLTKMNLSSVPLVFNLCK